MAWTCTLARLSHLPFLPLLKLSAMADPSQTQSQQQQLLHDC